MAKKKDKPAKEQATGAAVRGRPFQKGALNPRNIPGSGSGTAKGQVYTGVMVKQAVLDAFKTLGAEKYLLQLARSPKHRQHFITLLARAMPVEVTGKDGGPIDLQVLRVARNGLANLSHEELEQLLTLFRKIGVTDIPTAEEAANDGQAVPLLTGPAPERASA